MKKIYSTLLWAVCCCNVMLAQNLEPLWVTSEITGGQRVMLRADSFGNVVSFGETYDSGPITGFITMKHDPDGNLLWKTTYDTYAVEYFADCAVDKEGSVYITGNSVDPFTNYNRFVLIKYSHEGDTLWTFFYGGTAAITNSARKLMLDGSGNLYLAGSIQYLDQNDSGLLLLKISPVGEVLWEATLRDGPYGYGTMDARLIEKRFFVWGQTGSPQGTRFVSWEVDMSGQTVAYHTTEPYSDSFTYYDRNFAIDNEGGFLVGDVCCEYRAIRFNKDGSMAWQYNKPFTFSPLPTVPARLTGFSVDEKNDAYIGGSFYQSDTTDFCSLTTKLDRSGNLLWEHLFTSQTNPSMGVRHINSTSLGILSVGSASTIDKSRLDFLTIYYSPDQKNLWAGLYKTDSSSNSARASVFVKDAFYVAGIRSPLQSLSEKNRQILAKYHLPTSSSSNPEKQPADIPLSIYPNPFSQALILRFEQSGRPEQGDIRVHDAAGRMLLQKRVALVSGHNEIPLHLEAIAPTGVYYISLQSGEHQYTVRAVKK